MLFKNQSFTAGVDFSEPLPSTVILNSTTPVTGACSVIRLNPDGQEEGTETFSVAITPAAGSQVVVVEGRGSAQVVVVELCESLTAPDSGSVTFSAREIGSVATYSCADQLTLSGDSQRTCQANLKWSGEAPLCLGIL